MARRMFTVDPRHEKALAAAMLVFVAIGLYVAAWIALFGPASRSGDFKAWWALALSMAYSYQVGYRSIGKRLGPLVFVPMFLLPTVLQFIGVAIRVVRLYL
ncbi:hypothetical protein D9T17_20095 [Lysobacter enzymogenes]|uniref:Transmembrane protein n=2 Tax=Lysobacter enzymogenes TaxID=69 RepID=A0A3N2RCI5_LYSEN|nr:hypothetical protein D9T17_20095 [Lysobacter enzymogenes]